LSDWPHAPVHRLTEQGAYMITAGTYKKAFYLNAPAKLAFVRDTLFEIAELYHWLLQAWSIMGNHYHFIAIAPEDPTTLKHLIRKFHSITAREMNRQDNIHDRKFWFQYWDSHITFEKSYLARLNYVHNNPVRHGIVKAADQYEWCSAKWFALKASSAFQKTVLSFKIDRIKVVDDF
jgi:putative transposase